MSIQVFNESKVVTSGRNKITSVTSDTTHIYVSFKDGKLFVYERIDGTAVIMVFTKRSRTAISRERGDSELLGLQKGCHHDALRGEVESPVCSERQGNCSNGSDSSVIVDPRAQQSPERLLSAKYEWLLANGL